MKVATRKAVVSEETKEKVANILSAIETSNSVLALHNEAAVLTLRDQQLIELKTILLQKKSNVNVWNNVQGNVLLGNLLSDTQQKVDPRTVLNQQCIWIGGASAQLSPSNIISFCIPNDLCTHTVCFSMQELITHIHKYKVEDPVPNIWADELKQKLPAALHAHISPVMNNDWVDYIKTHHKILNMNDITKQLKARDMHMFNWLLKKLVEYAQLVPGVLFLGTFITRIGEKIPSFMQGWLKYSKLTLMSIFNNPSWIFMLTFLSKGLRLLLCMKVINLAAKKVELLKKMIYDLFVDKPVLKELSHVIFVFYECFMKDSAESNCSETLGNAFKTLVFSLPKYAWQFLKFCFNSFTSGELKDLLYEGMEQTFGFVKALGGVSSKPTNDAEFITKHLSGVVDKYYWQAMGWICVFHYPAAAFHGLVSIITSTIPGLSSIIQPLHLHYRFEELKQLKKKNNKKLLSIGHIFTLIIKIKSVFDSMRLIYEELRDWINLFFCYLQNKTQIKQQKGGYDQANDPLLKAYLNDPTTVSQDKLAKKLRDEKRARFREEQQNKAANNAAPADKPANNAAPAETKKETKNPFEPTKSAKDRAQHLEDNKPKELKKDELLGTVCCFESALNDFIALTSGRLQ